MGCCFSTNKPPEQNSWDPKNQPFPARHHPSEPDTNRGREESRAPPPVVDVETVKEVLSETPFSKPYIPNPEQKTKANNVSEIQLQPEKFEDKSPYNNITEEPSSQKAEDLSEVSQVSEMYSVTESISTTTTIAEKREEEATSKRRTRTGEFGQRVSRSPAKGSRKRPNTIEIASGRERRAKSPASRVDPSPEKTQYSSRPVRGRENGLAPTRRKQNVGPGSIGESGRRSRSPSTRTASVTRKESIGRSPKKPAARANRQPPTVTGNVETQAGGGVSKENDDVSQHVNESLENPHVSLECFIFL